MRFDVAIIGSGIAGLSLALQLSSHLRVAVITQGALIDSTSSYARGGIAVAVASDDSIDEHIQDTLVCGAGLSNPCVVNYVANEGNQSICWLQEQGVHFTHEYGELHLGKEGGHSHRRILHVADHTGQAIQECLVAQVRKTSHVTVFEHCLAIDLSMSTNPQRCHGVYLLDKSSQSVVTIVAQHTVLACGGASKAYLYTTSPQAPCGNGIALGWRAGCAVANMEFMQFHPTCLYEPRGSSFLISEAVRGEGALLRNSNNERFMPKYTPQAELAPRDEVARAIDHEIKSSGAHCVYLDLSPISNVKLKEHFPTITARTQAMGIDPSKDYLPVVPAAHYSCGGVLCDIRGTTNVSGIYCIGENANTGLHGANRLASNSLLECLVFAHGLAQHLNNTPSHDTHELPWQKEVIVARREDVMVSYNWDAIRRLMWNYVGIVRSDERLTRAAQRIALIRDEIEDYYAQVELSPKVIELRNLALCAELTVKSAQQRRESRGLHYNVDCPTPSTDIPQDTVLYPPSSVPLTLSSQREWC